MQQLSTWEGSSVKEDLQRRGRSDDVSVVGSIRRDLSAFAEHCGASTDAQEAIALAVSEALTNAVRHAYIGRAPGEVRVSATLEDDGRIAVIVSDDGAGMIPRTKDVHLGLGLRLISYMADDVTISRGGLAGGTTVAMRFARDRAEPPLSQLPRLRVNSI
jgi:anti-sigma regulatory factor (Ser/Thr protein kinase)